MSTELPRAFGPYLLLKNLGTGATGDVFLARPIDAGYGVPSPVVVKRLHFELATEQRFVRRFQHEVEIATRIDSPFVVGVFDAGRVEQTLYLAMEYVQGWPLQRVLDYLTKSGHGPPSLEAVWGLMDPILRGAAALHAAGVVHRDLAPKNVMVAEDGTSKLIDLGLGKSTFRDWKTATGMIMGSPGFMAPEQIAAEETDHRADIFSIGVILYELLTLKDFIPRAPIPEMLRIALTRPTPKPSGQRPDLPPEIDAVCMKALASDPGHRFETAEEMRAALAEATPKRARSDLALRSLLGQILWSEAATGKNEVSRLLSEVVPDRIEKTEHIIFARREPTQSMLSKTMTEVRTTDLARALPSVTSTPPPTRTRKKSSLLPWLLLAVLVPGALIFGMVIERSRTETPVTPQGATPDPPTPSVAPRKVAPPPVRPPPERVRRAPPPPPRKKSPKRTSPPPPTVAEEAPPPTKVVPPAPFDVQAELSRVQREAVELHRPLPDSPRKDRIKALVVEISKTKAMKPKREDVERLEARLRALRRN